MKKLSVLVLIGCIFPVLILAQGLGNIVGTVTDPSGSVIPGATVKVTELGTGLTRSATTNADGYYVLSSLKPSQYGLAITSAGFRTFNQKDLTLLADQALTVNAKLELGTANEVIEVTGTQLQVDTTTSTLKNVVEQQRLTELPLQGRNAATLTLTTAGAAQANFGGADQGTTKTFPGAVQITVNGARQNQISYQLDGGNYVDEYTNVNQPFPNPDALQEFSVQTSNYSAEYGQNAGAVVNVITKSGTNKLHGSAFEFVRTPALNARRWDQPTKDEIHRNQFGGTVGGPIRHDRTFFFAAYQGTIFHNVLATTSQPVPNVAQRASATDPAVIKLLSFIPIGDASGRANFARPDLQNFQEVTARVDHAFSRKTLIAVRYFYDRFTRNAVFDPHNILNYSDGSTIRSQNLLVHVTYIFRPTLINDFRFSFAPETAQRGPAVNSISVQDLGVSIPFQPSPKAIQQIRVNGGFSFGDNPTASF